MFPDWLSWLAGAILLVVFVWVLIRTASVAYFRTKLEFLRSALRELRKENGKNG